MGVVPKSLSANEINTFLGRFYADASPKQSEKQTSGQNIEYHKNSFKSIRSAVNRYLHVQDLGPDFDIVRGRDIRTRNNILDGKLKNNL